MTEAIVADPDEAANGSGMSAGMGGMGGMM
jgi:hypothetical protein